MDYENAYRSLLNDAITEPITPSRTGDIRRLYNITLRVDLRDGFPMLTGRRMFWKNVMGEAEWMLSGSTNIIDLHKYGVHIWDTWADERGELGPTYGAQLAKQWNSTILNIVRDPLSRRHVINLWNVDELHKMKLPPCYFALQFYVTRNRLNMTVTSRSSDLAVGLPYDIAVLAYLLHRMAELTYLDVGELCFNACDAHINVENEAAIYQYFERPFHPLPKLWNNYKLVDYISGPHIPMTVKA